MKTLIVLLVTFVQMLSAFSQKTNIENVPYHHTRLPSNPVPEGVSSFYLVYDLSKVSPKYMQEDYELSLDKITINGLTRSENEGVKIMVFPDTLSVTHYANSSKYNDKMRYNQVVTVNRTLKYKLTMPDADEAFIEDIIDGHKYIKHGEWQTSQSSAESWYINNRSRLIQEYDPEIKTKNINALSARISNAIGHGRIKGSVPIGTIKKFKKYSYPELDRALTNAKGALALHAIEDEYMPIVIKDKLQESLLIWENMLLSKNLKEKNSKVNNEVAALLYQNLLIVYGLMDEYDKVDALYQEIESLISSYHPKSWESYLENWKNYVDYRRKRVLANQR
ncbi:MAG: hypothetical protein ABJH98_02045 [Reichenbachiella sp.]|uniref:hypothetical protein n=1 Tax=Reichenbachiella sp. TaxID=2184521 RepID=UPI00329A7951